MDLNNELAAVIANDRVGRLVGLRLAAIDHPVVLNRAAKQTSYLLYQMDEAELRNTVAVASLIIAETYRAAEPINAGMYAAKVAAFLIRDPDD